MKKGKFLFVIGFSVISSLVFGQDYAFKVLANKGSNEVKSGDSWQPIKTGASLKLGDELKVSENSYLGLVHVSGKPMELKQAGPYKVSDLAAKIGGGATVLNKYTDFILSSNSAESKKNRLSATGAVHRGVEDIKVFLPDNQYSSIYNNNIIFSWESKSSGPYVVTLKNMFEDELMKVETPENNIEVSLTDPKFASESAILIEVKYKAEPKSTPDQHLIKKLPPEEQKRIKNELSGIEGDLKDQSAMDYLTLAGFYEKNNLLIDAITAYQKAIKLAPDVSTFKEYYEEFLLRNKIKSAK